MNEQLGKHRKPEEAKPSEEQILAQRQTDFINRMLGIVNPAQAVKQDPPTPEDRGFHYYG